MLDDLLAIEPYSLSQGRKAELYTQKLSELTQFHHQRCPAYRRILEILRVDPARRCTPEEQPFIPVRLFKLFDLASVEPQKVHKTMTSSGTSGQAASRIALDQENALNQAKVLAKIMSSFLGPRRLPMLIIDHPGVVRTGGSVSARAAGVLGFSRFGTDVTYALNDDLSLCVERVEQFCAKYSDKPVLLFGFTFMVWANFVQALAARGMELPLSQGILIHGGGWKRLRDQAVTNERFKQGLAESCGIRRVHNYYGMVEQSGSVFVECENGYLHCSVFSDVIIRNTNFGVCGRNERGLIQLLSLLPTSYPGHSVLSEDIGELCGEDDCACGRLGRYFRIVGRLEQAEIRGCSDVQA